jgi:type III restriction enzyme
VIELFEFQQQASATMADRFIRYNGDPVVTGTKSNLKTVPFYQALASITASGKTVILAEVVSSISAALPVPPVVLWLSKGRVVVDQTLANLLPGGKYHHLLGPSEVRPLAEYDTEEVADLRKPIVYFATVGTFNQRDKEKGSLVIYRCDIDVQDQSTWDAMKQRLTKDDVRRPLIVVYDEAHNLTDQQTDLLLELEPSAFLLASATMRLPERLSREVEQPLRQAGWDDESLITAVDAKAVADSGLVKSSVVMAGYQSPMEETVTSMLADFDQADQDARDYGLNGLPKAIYVCNTNIIATDASRQDDPKQPFAARQAPPILIWRQLVEVHGIDRDEIAVYCSLKMDRNYPAPDGFHLFKGGEKDYEQFASGSFRHIIFNLSLQEGWDDPLAYFGYVDKSMDSRVQVEQVIGRVLRQPDAQHSRSERLNTAQFYVRVDRNQVFADIIKAVGKKLQSEAPALRVVASPPGKPKPVEYKPKRDMRIPATALDTFEAVEPVATLIRQLTNYQHADASSTQGEGSRAIVQRRVGGGKDGEVVWESFEQSSRVLARWIFQREVRKRHPGALGVAPTSDAKFDAEVGLGSQAEVHVVQVAERVVSAFLENVSLIQKPRDPYVVGPQLVRPDDAIAFRNAVHDGYDGLNDLEEDFARALEKTEARWCRNPSRTGYRIPLPTLGPTQFFYPDFIVWSETDVFAIDTKGGHLLAEAAVRKLLWIDTPRGATERLFVKLVSEGKYTADATLETKDGYTLWGVRAGSRAVRNFSDMETLVAAVLTARRG